LVRADSDLVYAHFVGASDNFGLISEIAVVLLFVVIFGALLGWSFKVAANDARRRGKSPVLVWIACVLFFPWGLVAWVLFRPDPIDKGKSGFELEDYRLQ
jgi:hypothetical protein